MFYCGGVLVGLMFESVFEGGGGGCVRVVVGGAVGGVCGREGVGV